MGKPELAALEDLAPYVKEFLLPEIQQSMEACIRAYWDDEYNDMWIFGTHFWKNTWNRFVSAVSFEDCPFEVCGNGNEYKLKLGQFIIRHHRIDEESKLPNGAKAVKESAAIQMPIFGDDWNKPIEIDNIVLAIDADFQNGLKEVFLGELIQIAPFSNKYTWAKKVHIYQANDSEKKAAEVFEFPTALILNNLAPAEDVPEVPIELDKSKINKQLEESDPEI